MHITTWHGMTFAQRSMCTAWHGMANHRSFEPKPPITRLSGLHGVAGAKLYTQIKMDSSQEDDANDRQNAPPIDPGNDYNDDHYAALGLPSTGCSFGMCVNMCTDMWRCVQTCAWPFV